MVRQAEFQLFLRAHPTQSKAELEYLKKIFGVTSAEGTFRGVVLDEDDGIAMFEFSGGEPIHGEPPIREEELRELEQWQEPEFRVAGQWFHSKSRSEFDGVVDKGVKLELVVRGYKGLIPDPILIEIVRLGISLWIFS